MVSSSGDSLSLQVFLCTLSPKDIFRCTHSSCNHITDASKFVNCWGACWLPIKLAQPKRRGIWHLPCEPATVVHQHALAKSKLSNILKEHIIYDFCKFPAHGCEDLKRKFYQYMPLYCMASEYIPYCLHLLLNIFPACRHHQQFTLPRDRYKRKRVWGNGRQCHVGRTNAHLGLGLCWLGKQIPMQPKHHAVPVRQYLGSKTAPGNISWAGFQDSMQPPWAHTPSYGGARTACSRTNTRWVSWCTTGFLVLWLGVYVHRPWLMHVLVPIVVVWFCTWCNMLCICVIVAGLLVTYKVNLRAE